MDLQIVALVAVTAILGIPYASIFEWSFHRYVMHKPLRWFRYPYEAHTLTHHKIFKADHTYHVQRESDKKKIPMAWWNVPFIILMRVFPFAIAATPFIFFDWWQGSVAISVTGVVLSVAYYATYEYFHWCMHLPKDRLWMRSRFLRWLFRLLNGHHLLHHRYMGTNFNVVCPIADLLFGTLITRAKFKFAQATGPSVPDVQPLSA